MDSYTFKLLERINKISNEENKHQKIFLQVNIGEDPNKYGFTEKDVFAAAEQTKNFSLFYQKIFLEL